MMGAKNRRLKIRGRRLNLYYAGIGLLIVSGVLIASTFFFPVGREPNDWIDIVLNLAIASFGIMIALLLMNAAKREQVINHIFEWLRELDSLLSDLAPPLRTSTLRPIGEWVTELFPERVGWIMLVRAPGLLLRGEVIRRKYLPIGGENEKEKWNVGWAESLIKNELDGETKQNRIVAFVPNEKSQEKIAIIQTAQNQSGDIGAGIALAIRKRKYKRDPLLFQALALGIDMIVQRVGSILMEVVHRREGLGVENLGLVMRILAHELNNDLQGALNNMDTYEDLWAEKSELSVRSLRSLLTRAGYWTSLMREAPFLVDEVLPFERNIVQMNGEIRNVLRDVRAAWPDVMFMVEMDDNINVVGDQHVRSILRNLLHNAASYTPMEGKVEVRVNVEYDKAHIYVEDEGPGVDPSDVDKIFAPLESIKEGRKAGARADYGMGLGLTLSRAIARAYGGELTCHSNRKMEGGLFELILPLAEETTENG